MIALPDPGPLPTLPPPAVGQAVVFEVDGHPPFKDFHFSIRNPRHRNHARLASLRAAAIRAMGGRCWYSGPVALDLEIHSPTMERPILDSVGGVMDTLDGSHGPSFTYLPIAYQDDCQVASGCTQYVKDVRTFYRITLRFMPSEWQGEQVAQQG